MTIDPFQVQDTTHGQQGPQGPQGPMGPTGPGKSNGQSTNINIPVTDFSSIKQSINFSSTLTTTIKQSDINAQLDNFTNTKQVYTFGPSIPPRWVAVGEGTTNTIAYSTDGITWTGLGNSIFTSACYGVEYRILRIFYLYY